MTPETIKKLRTERGWSQQQMAVCLGLNRSSVSRLEAGQEPSGPTLKLLELLAVTEISKEAAE